MASVPVRRVSVAGPLLALLLGSAGCSGAVDDPSPGADPTATSSPPVGRPTGTAPTVTAPTVRPQPALAGRVIVLDPGHQLGNAAHPAEVRAPVDAGGFTKPCNTTGTATADGYAEATFVWEVALETRRLLRRLGARVLLTRASNSADAWGPCVDERGRAGNPGGPGATADLKISIHADGSLEAGAHGFHVIAPEQVAPWTTDIADASLRLAQVVRDALVDEGVALSSYAGSAGIDVRGDLGTLNLSDVPAVLVELGNMRDSGDAALMTSRRGRRAYASALASSVERFLAR